MSTTTTINQVGGLYTISPTGRKLCFPLKHTGVQAKIAGNISRVEVIQSFENPFDLPLEAVYVFPLPEDAAVDDMEIKIADISIKGSIQRREQARQIYEQAKQQGRIAGLLEQERDNIFTQSLANIQPGEKIEVTIRYTDSLKFLAGNYEFVFPMVVGPRYIPGTPIDHSGDTDCVPDASLITPPVIPPELRSRHEINVNVELNPGLPILNITSPSHKLQIGQTGEIIEVSLAGEDNIPNKDFILRYQVAGQYTQATVLTQSDSRGGHFAVYLIPALAYQSTAIIPKDVVFLIDTSGSQSGAPIQQCQELMRRFINGLNPEDTFNIIDFAQTTRKLSSTPLANTPETRAIAIQYINNLAANGGTELLNGIREVLQLPVISARLRSIVLLTDGFIGNEKEILAEIQKNLKPGNRLYSFGAGSSVNRFLLNRVAEIGRGVSTIIRHDEPTDKVVENFFQQINNPILTNIQVTWEGDGEAPVIYPTSIPDLFTAQPLILFGRQPAAHDGVLRIDATAAGGQIYTKTLHLNFFGDGNPAIATPNPGIAQLWGRAKIKHLTNQMFSYNTKAGVEEITNTALTYQLLSEYTAFVAISEEIRVNPAGESITVRVPVEMPEGVNYHKGFGEYDQYDQLRPRGSVLSPSPQYSPQSYTNDLHQSELSVGIAPQSVTPSSKNQPVCPPDQSKKMSKTHSEIFQEVSQQLEEVFGGDSEPVPSYIAESPESENLSIILPQLQVVSVSGLTTSEADALTEYLQKVHLPKVLPGEVVFEFNVEQGRVKQLVLDEDASILTDITVVVEEIKRSLLAWAVPIAAKGQVRLVIRIN